MPTTAEPLIHYLRQLESNGQTHVNLDEDARQILRAFYIKARGQAVTKPHKPTAASTDSTAATVATVNATPGSTTRPSTPQPSPEPAPEPEAIRIAASGASAAEKIDSLKQQAAKWPQAQSLSGLRNTMVFSVGNPEADIMLVGEAPGYDEERLREPFVGKAGQKLNGILQAMGINRETVYISNIVKFRPSMPNQTTNNRKPTREEMDACMPFIREEIKVVQPKVIIALGGTAAQALLDSEQSVGSMRGNFHTYQDIPLRVTYHPSYILHNEATTEKRKLWEDMLAVMDHLNMPISDKQRGFFLPKSSS